MRPIRSGSVTIGGRRLTLAAIRARRSLAGVAHVPEDRLGTGLAPSLSVTSNVVIKTYRRRSLTHGPLLALRRMRDVAVGIIRRYDVKTPGPDTPARNLSGGNLQKLILGREFEDDPIVLVAAQPTRGLDVGAIETVHDVPPRGRGARRCDAADERGPRRDPRARRPDPRRSTRVRSSASSDAGAASIEELGYPHGRRARGE